MPDGIPPRDHDRLRRFVLDTELFLQRVGELPIFNNQDHAARDFGMSREEVLYLCVGSGAARTLRAMLEKHNRFFLRSLEKRVKILFLV